ncbi:MAG TPA: TolC family protein [Lacipirellulaceae bacterium]|nr:TolC family protein [Lacipirellulaceae bacterium]
MSRNLTLSDRRGTIQWTAPIVAVLAAALMSGTARAQSLRPERLPPPFAPPAYQTEFPVDKPLTTAPEAPPCRMDMSTALALVAGQNPKVGFARSRIREAYANVQAARVLWLPSIQAGASYHHNEGNLQDSNGAILNVNRSSLQAGLGAGAVGAGTTTEPGLFAQFHVVDAIFQPKIAERTAWAWEHQRDAVLNDQLLEAAVAYQELLRAYQLRAITAETLQRTQRLAVLTANFAAAGEGTQADADRSQAAVALRRNDVARSEEAVAVASARLAQVISLDTAAQIIPVEDNVTTIDLVSADRSSQAILAMALVNRPELKESHDLVDAACERLRREKYAPLVPSVLLGASYDGFGGGVGDTLAEFNHRADFDAIALWQIRSLGWGEIAARDSAAARLEQQRQRQVELLDQVAREVSEANAKVRTRRGRVAVAEAGTDSARASLRRSFDRIQQGQGLPIEVLEAIQALDATERDWINAIVDYNVAQFQLQRAIGWPIQSPQDDTPSAHRD